ncbi:hypothetical protein M2113_001647, partial [Aurantimicrobium minutum]|nr:hypothetical protein [Aurantimicrobium minutum]
KDTYASVTKVSAPTVAVAALTFTASPTPTISGAAQFGQTLTASAGTWSPMVAPSYVWKRDGVAIVDATDSTYTLAPEDVGKRITVETTGMHEGYTTVTKKSAQTALVAPLNFTVFPAPVIIGTPMSGEILSVDSAAWTPSADEVTFTWRYLGSSTVLGTGITYELLDSDIGKALTVTVTGAKDGYFTRSVRSNATTKVIAAD